MSSLPFVVLSVTRNGPAVNRFASDEDAARFVRGLESLGYTSGRIPGGFVLVPHESEREEA